MILKTIVCDGPTCEQAVRVPLDAPLRDLLPTGWYALAIPPEEVDAHFCSAVCLGAWTLDRVMIEKRLAEEQSELAVDIDGITNNAPLMPCPHCGYTIGHGDGCPAVPAGLKARSTRARKTRA